MRPAAVALSFLAMAGATVPSAHAHDLWIIPASFRPAAGAAVAVEVRVGEKFPESMNAPRATLTRFALVTAGGSTDVSGARTQGKALLASVTPREGGTSAIVLEGKPSHIVLTPEQFKDYLLHEGLAHIHAEREKSGEAGKPARENYSRHSKALIRVGAGASVATRPLGLALELVPAADPYDLVPGQPLPVKAVFHGRPLAGLELRAYTVGSDVQRVRTGDDGTATVQLDRAGVWCIAFIHMERCAGCADADWRSFFGTLTFELPAAR
jgi:uncharacterized GH25 family protein